MFNKENQNVENSEELIDSKPNVSIVEFARNKEEEQKKDKVIEPPYFVSNLSKITSYRSNSFNFFTQLKNPSLDLLFDRLNQDGVIWAVKNRADTTKRLSLNFRSANLLCVEYSWSVDEILGKYGDQLTAIFKSPDYNMKKKIFNVAVFRLEEPVTATLFDLIHEAFFRSYGSNQQVGGRSKAFVTIKDGLFWKTVEERFLDVKKLLSEFSKNDNFKESIRIIQNRYQEYGTTMDLIEYLNSKYDLSIDVNRFKGVIDRNQAYQHQYVKQIGIKKEASKKN